MRADSPARTRWSCRRARLGARGARSLRIRSGRAVEQIKQQAKNWMERLLENDRMSGNRRPMRTLLLS